MLILTFDKKNSITGDRWKSTVALEFRYDDEIHGYEIRTCIKDLQYSESNYTTEALNGLYKVPLF